MYCTAILYYRQAVQLVPDIDRRASKKPNPFQYEDDEEEEEEDIEIIEPISNLSLLPDDDDDGNHVCYQNFYSKVSQ